MASLHNSLFAHQHQLAKLDIKDPLLIINEVVDFSALAQRIDELHPVAKSPLGGRPPYPTQVMVRTLFLKHFNGLSYEQTEYQLLDRDSFKRFAKLTNSPNIPDHSTLWAFEQKLGEGGARALFDAVMLQINAAGFSARCGQAVDGTLIHAPKQHFTKEEKAQLEAGERPDWSDRKAAQKDLDATWTKKHGKSYYGYKQSVGVDIKHKIIRTVEMSTASEHDTKHFEAIVTQDNTGSKVYADKGYDSEKNREYLKSQGLTDKIQRKAKRGKPLGMKSESRNKTIAKTRSRVEHTFASLKQITGGVIRTIGIERAKFGMMMGAICYNIKRFVTLKVMGLDGFLRPKTVQMG